MKVLVKEIFSSIQGEGLYVGQKHLFVRLCGCNLNCAYCDTDHNIEGAIQYDINSLVDKILSFDDEIISFTGGEPLIHVDFLSELFPILKSASKTIYLETNGTLPNELNKIKDFVDIIAVDFKLKSATGEENRFDLNKKFINIAPCKSFIKIVFDKNIEDFEIDKVLYISGDVPIVLQPKMPLEVGFDFEKIFDKFYKKNKNVRLICQTHKFLNVR